MDENDKPDTGPSAGEQGGGAESAPMIPKARFDQVNTRLHSATAENEALKAKLQALEAERQKPAPAKDAPAPESPPEAKPSPKPTELPAQDTRVLALRLDEGIGAEAARLVLKYEDSGVMSRSEALAFARSRQPELFGGADKRGFDPTTHSATPPASGPNTPPKPAEPTAFDKMRETRDLNMRQKMAVKGAADLVRRMMRGS